METKKKTKKINFFNLCDSEGTGEAIVATTMRRKTLEKAWYDYYWSSNYENHVIFVGKMKLKGKEIELMGAKNKIIPN